MSIITSILEVKGLKVWELMKYRIKLTKDSCITVVSHPRGPLLCDGWGCIYTVSTMYFSM